MTRTPSPRSLTPVAAALAAALSTLAAQAHTPVASVTGVVAGNGYYQGAKVCLDLNRNGRCDSFEPSGNTDAAGHYSFNGHGLQAVATLVAEVGTGAKLGGAAVTRALTLRAPVGSAVISPLSTELLAAIDASEGHHHHGTSGPRAALAARVGVTAAQLLEDPNTQADAAVKSLLDTENAQLLDRIAYAVEEAGKSGNLIKALRNRLALDAIEHVVVVYLENRSFDNLFGSFPGANGLSSAAAKAVQQADRDGVTLFTKLPPAFGGLTAAGQTNTAGNPVTQAQTTQVWPNAPFQIDATTDLFGYGLLSSSVITRDLFHRFFENQMQANGGKNNLFAAWGDAGGLVMGTFDGSKTQLWTLAQQNVLADHFFEGAWGGSFLNHQYLICACAPTVDAAVVKANGMSVNVLDEVKTATLGVPQLVTNASTTASALDGAPSFKTGNIAPLDYFGTGDGYRAVNTMQPAFQPSGNAPAASGNTLYADPSKPNTLPAQTQTTIGDLLDAKNVSWAWYSGGWNLAVASRSNIYNANSFGTSDATHGDFQAHHQPFNYFSKLDPVNNAAYRAAHLKDRADLLADAQAGTLPAVAFYKPVGQLNQHPGYANVTDADAEVATLITALKAGPQWKHTVVVITYDEFGGQYDHAAVPKGDKLGPGTRIPALVVSPFAKKGVVDHTPYDTASILRLITHRYSLPVLDGLQKRDAAVAAAIGRPLGDLTNALDFSQGRHESEEGHHGGRED